MYTNLYKTIMVERTSPTQFQCMVEFMKRHGDLSEGRDGPLGRLVNTKKWEELVTILNLDASGKTRTMERWRKVWSDFKNNTKKKFMKIAQQEAEIKDNESKGITLNKRSLILTALEQDVLDIIKRKYCIKNDIGKFIMNGDLTGSDSLTNDNVTQKRTEDIIGDDFNVQLDTTDQSEESNGSDESVAESIRDEPEHIDSDENESVEDEASNHEISNRDIKPLDTDNHDELQQVIVVCDTIRNEEDKNNTVQNEIVHNNVIQYDKGHNKTIQNRRTSNNLIQNEQLQDNTSQDDTNQHNNIQKAQVYETSQNEIVHHNASQKERKLITIRKIKMNNNTSQNAGIHHNTIQKSQIVNNLSQIELPRLVKIQKLRINKNQSQNETIHNKSIQNEPEHDYITQNERSRKDRVPIEIIDDVKREEPVTDTSPPTNTSPTNTPEVESSVINETNRLFSKIIEQELGLVPKRRRIECLQELLGVIKKYNT